MIPRMTTPAAAIDRQAISATYEVIGPHIRVTPAVTVSGADFGLAAFRLTLKLELLQHAGSFKTRGAFANLLTRRVPDAGVVAASGGNHGAAVAYAAMRLKMPARIFFPVVSSPAKIARIRGYGAELSIVGDRYADALEASERLAAASGALQVHAFDQVETLLGQGTLALELHTQAADLDTILVAVGGGGLIGGIASWYAGDARIIGVEPDGAPTGSIAADSLAPRRVGELTFAVAKTHLAGVVLVGDAGIRRAQEALWETLRIVAEPGGAAAFAALLDRCYEPSAGEHVGVIISGGNTTAVDFGGAVAGE
jgi:threonine dehydratase